MGLVAGVVILCGVVWFGVCVYRLFKPKSTRLRAVGGLWVAMFVVVIGGAMVPDDPEAVAARQAAADAQAAQEAEWAALEEAACRDDINCWGERHWEYASVYCGPLIENLAAYQHEWDDGGYTPNRFRRAVWADKSAGDADLLGQRDPVPERLRGVVQDHLRLRIRSRWREGDPGAGPIAAISKNRRL